MLANWWQRFDDPVLTQLVNQALLAHTSVVSAQAALRQAQALRDVAAAALSPTVGAAASAQRSEAGQGDTGTGGNTYNAGLNAAWLPDLWGGLRLALAAADATALASAATLGDVQVAVAGEVALAYITLRSGQLRLVIARANLANQLETLQITRWRQQAGLLPVLDTEQARAAADAATQAAALARQRYDSGLADFQTVLETQRNRRTTQDGVATATAAISADQVRLFRALGGGWVPTALAPTTTDRP